MTCHIHSTHSVLSPSLRHWRLTWFKFKLLPCVQRPRRAAPRSLPTLLLVCCVPPSRKCVSFSCFVRYHLGNKQSYVFDVRSLVIFPTTYLRSDTLLPLCTLFPSLSTDDEETSGWLKPHPNLYLRFATGWFICWCTCLTVCVSILFS